jgi:hypothetical protein
MKLDRMTNAELLAEFEKQQAIQKRNAPARRMAEHAGAELLDLAEALRVALPQLEATPRAHVTAHAAADIVRAALIKNGWSP